MWQKFYQQHRGENFEILSIAVDVQGPAVVRPFTEKFGVTFPVTVDSADVLGQAFGLTIIPETFLVDEVGIIRLHGNGPEAALLRQIESVLKETPAAVRAEMPQLPAARSLAELEHAVRKSPTDWPLRLAQARLYDSGQRYAEAAAQLEAASQLQPHEWSIPFLWGLVLLHQNHKDAALSRLKHARDLAPDNWRIRKQIWALEHPDKFYSGDSPDYGWQKEELAREKDAAGK